MKGSTDEKTLFEVHGGLHLRDTVLWFDASKPRQLCFISHANVPHALVHQKILATDRTAQLLQALAAADGRGRRAHQPQALVTPYRRPFSLGQLSLELFPAGHVLGSASLLVRHQGRSIVYAGEINPRRGSAGERLEARRCDVLAMPCRFCQRRFVFPPYDQLVESVVRFARESLQRGTTPVFFCPPLGEAQELSHMLLQAGIPVRAHRQIYSATRVYQQSGPGWEGVRRYTGAVSEAEALLWPVGLRHSPTLGRLERASTAFVSGMALDEALRAQMACDAAFPLSCHADYPGLLEYVQACQPAQVVLTRGTSEELGQDLRALGVEVSDVGPPHQMALF